jgi:hypothetical protein
MADWRTYNAQLEDTRSAPAMNPRHHYHISSTLKVHQYCKRTKLQNLPGHPMASVAHETPNNTWTVEQLKAYLTCEWI